MSEFLDDDDVTACLEHTLVEAEQTIEPVNLEAVNGLLNLEKGELIEVMNLAKPSPSVLCVWQALTHLLKMPARNWNDCQKAIS